MATLTSHHRRQMLDHAYDCHPEESCGLLVGDTAGIVSLVVPTTNVLHSSTNYTIDPGEHLAAVRKADELDLDVVGVFHSHPHTPGYPSATDVSLAPDPDWLYVLVGMNDFDSPTVRGFRIRDGEITEEELEFLEETE